MSVKPRLYKGFRDIFATDIRQRNAMIETIRNVYELYGFQPLETPAIEYVDILGKFLPESDQPEGGIFSWKNEDNEWIALRYDLTAPLSRVVSMYPDLPKPFRRYQVGPVYRFEKPGPGRFREFYQFDFDTVGTSSVIADAEICCVICDTFDALGIEIGQYIVKVNNRKVLNGVLEAAGLTNFSKVITSEIVDAKGSIRKSVKEVTTNDIFRSIDKIDKIGMDGVVQLLTSGRRDSSGDFTPGLQLSDQEVQSLVRYLTTRGENRALVCDQLEDIVGKSPIGLEGISELREIDRHLTALGYEVNQVEFDPLIVRGLSYYTGPVYEGILTFQITDEDGMIKSFGSVFGGGRYDNLVERFTGQKVPATGASIGVDRLLAALTTLNRHRIHSSLTEVLVTILDKNYATEYHQIVHTLRKAGIKTELFLGSGNIGKQLKYADSLRIPFAIIAGESEFEKGTVQIKDLELGRQLSDTISDRSEWRQEQPAQFEVPKENMVAEIIKRLNRTR
ncbi:MAG: histidine--tRNA ligase [bacterium]|nr:histidine--tRNA ligase [bacterium]